MREGRVRLRRSRDVYAGDGVGRIISPPFFLPHFCRGYFLQAYGLEPNSEGSRYQTGVGKRDGDRRVHDEAAETE